jgi:orotate phosphoribosyltransferase
VDREEGGREALEEKGLRVIRLLTAADILRLRPEDTIADAR